MELIKLGAVGAAIVFGANMVSNSQFVAKGITTQTDPNGAVAQAYKHANVLVGAVGLVLARKFKLV